MRPDPPVESRWLYRLKDAAPGATKLVCFPYAGGNAQVFNDLARLLPDTVEVYGVELPGRGMQVQQPPVDRLDELVIRLERDTRELLCGPYCLYGCSMGALVAFEYARRLRRLRASGPQCLFVSAARAPHLPRRRPQVHDLPAGELKQALEHYGRTPAAVLREPELMELVLPIVRADFAVAETYRYQPEPALDIPIVAFGGNADSFVPVHELSAWEEHTTAGFRQQILPGDHFFHCVPEQQETVARLLASVLESPGSPEW